MRNMFIKSIPARFLPAVIMMAAFLFPACGDGDTADVVNVYSHRHYDADRRLMEMFTEETGIRVNVVSAGADQLIKRLEIEGEKSPADLLITVDAGRLYRATERGLLQPVHSEVLERNVPAHLRDPEGHWYGMTLRGRIIAYARDRVQPGELSTYEALADERWRGRILVRSSENIYNQSLLASIILNRGRDAAETWARAIVTNMARSPRGNDTDQLNALIEGVGDIALVNTYYVARLYDDSTAERRADAGRVGVFFPNQESTGTHVNISGIGMTKSAGNRENAIRLMEFLTSDRAQKLFAEGNHEYPIRPEIPLPPVLADWGTFRADTLHPTALGEQNWEAVKLFDEVDWR
jgi:iron(III) transport system substrate-binding protein